ncbi:MAG: hypothetical protein JSR17_02350 [Proteobacteria bacterium]|nr:hypothetical protein [Pseudomonadota bacterium]
MRNLNTAEVTLVSGGVGTAATQAISGQDIYPVVDLLAKFFTALEMVLRPTK